GNSGYLLPSSPTNEERFQWLAAAIRKYGGDASVVQVKSIDNISTPQLMGRFSEFRAREYQELIRELQAWSSAPSQKSRCRAAEVCVRALERGGVARRPVLQESTCVSRELERAVAPVRTPVPRTVARGDEQPAVRLD